MIKSMTGFGKGTTTAGSKIFSFDIRALNSKQLDLNLRIPASYRDKEGAIRNLLARAIERGKADVNFNIKLNSEASQITLNRQGIKARYEELKSLAEELGSDTESVFSLALSMPFLDADLPDESSEDDWNQAAEALNMALAELDKFRVDEGNGLMLELVSRVASINQLLIAIQPHEEIRISHIRAKLMARFAELAPDLNLNENRFEEELIYYIEKLDISEEKQRLQAHCTYFLDTMNEPVSSGRKLSFISQEMGREINTIGSKANQAEMQKIVVLMKDELEKIKEQLNNVL